MLCLSKEISAIEALQASHRQDLALIDVRSEGEFQQGHIPSFQNLPILNNIERHLVGQCYHQQSQDAAISLGYELVRPSREQRIAAWSAAVKASKKKQGLICCWRGGLRSRLAAETLRESGAEVWQVRGGYKAMRSELLTILDRPPEMLILGGYTGSGKTKLLSELPSSLSLDLEALAEHRGSSFGHFEGVLQPSVANFENRIAMELLQKSSRIVVESESRAIGKVYIPNQFAEKMQASPLIFLEMRLGERSKNIFNEYVIGEIRKGITLETIRDKSLQGVLQIKSRLGGALAEDLCNQIVIAFEAKNGLDEELHRQWISALLSQYYDKTYKHALERSARPILFRGEFEECRQWILQQYA